MGEYDRASHAGHRRLCVAPMMDWTDRHARYFLRLLAPRAFLYTEMVPAAGLWHAGGERFLPFDPSEHPVALQLGGSDPERLSFGAAQAAAWGYDEVNLNVGCPSDRVQAGQFGACLMAEPELVARCVRALAGHGIPVTVKTRIGIDHRDDDAFLDAFIDTVAEAGCRTFIVHARKAWLSGLSPRQNREVPPLNCQRVWWLKQRRPDLEVVINGGITDWEGVRAQLRRVDGVMVGRAVVHSPYLLAEWDHALFGGTPPTRHEAVAAYLPYVERQRAAGVRLPAMTKILLGLFNGCRGAKAWRRYLSEHAPRPAAGVEVIEAALARVPRSRIAESERA